MLAVWRIQRSYLFYRHFTVYLYFLIETNFRYKSTKPQMTAVQSRLFANITMLIRSPGNQCLEYSESERIGKYKIFVRITSAPVNVFIAWKLYIVESMTDRTTGGMHLLAAKCAPATANMRMIFFSMSVQFLGMFRPLGFHHLFNALLLNIIRPFNTMTSGTLLHVGSCHFLLTFNPVSSNGLFSIVHYLA
jgi:hypothetical protein